MESCAPIVNRRNVATNLSRENRINRRKHGISLETAARILEDPNIVSYRDRGVDNEEGRHAIGCAGGIAILFVVHTSEEQHGEEEIRIISARTAGPRERALYKPNTDKQRRELRRLAARPDSQIDFSDAPEGSPRTSDLEVGRFCTPIKRLLSLRVDADVLSWFRGRGKKYERGPPVRNADKRPWPIERLLLGWCAPLTMVL